MANLVINKNSTEEREVKVVVYVDGQEYTHTVQRIEEWAIPHVAFTVVAQVDDPDYEGAEETEWQG